MELKSVLSRWDLYCKAYAVAVVLALISFFPIVSSLVYSGHFGLGWLLLPLAFPVALVRLFLAYHRADFDQRKQIAKFSLESIVVYFVCSFGASFLGSYSLHWWSGFQITPMQLWALYMSPFGLVFIF